MTPDPDPTPAGDAVADQALALAAATVAARLDREALARARFDLARSVEFQRRLLAALVPFARELLAVGASAAAVATGAPPGLAALLTATVGQVADSALEHALQSTPTESPAPRA